MATRSVLAVQSGDSYKAVYCHWDGYPEHHLPILKTRYNSSKNAAKLIKPGDISILETEETWERNLKRPAQPLYYWERGERNVNFQKFSDLEKVADYGSNMCCEYMYVYVPRKGWYCQPL